MKIVGNVFEAHKTGINAYANGEPRKSPFANELMSKYFLAGYDGLELDGIRILTEKTEREAQARIADLARRVTSNKQFAAILKCADPCMRLDVYKAIKPHLKFRVARFRTLMILA